MLRAICVLAVGAFDVVQPAGFFKKKTEQLSMDRQAATEKMKTLYGKAKKARSEGQRAVAETFRSGAKRLQRKIAVDLRANPPVAEKTDAAE